MFFPHGVKSTLVVAKICSHLPFFEASANSANIFLDNDGWLQNIVQSFANFDGWFHRICTYTGQVMDSCLIRPVHVVFLQHRFSFPTQFSLVAGPFNPIDVAARMYVRSMRGWSVKVWGAFSLVAGPFNPIEFVRAQMYHRPISAWHYPSFLNLSCQKSYRGIPSPSPKHHGCRF